MLDGTRIRCINEMTPWYFVGDTATVLNGEIGYARFDTERAGDTDWFVDLNDFEVIENG